MCIRDWSTITVLAIELEKEIVKMNRSNFYREGSFVINNGISKHCGLIGLGGVLCFIGFSCFYWNICFLYW